MDAAAVRASATATSATARVRAAARAAGAQAVKVTSAAPDGTARERMAAAFARGDFATWPYDARRAAAASDPQSVLPGARSVICVALAYAHPRPAGFRPMRGRVSNYAWSADYHGRLRSLLETVARAVREIDGAARSRVVCDTAPLAERAFAARAGLGWVGKHTNLIAPGLGPFVFLGEVVTTLALEPDVPLRKSCGSCTRCVAACPTGALRGDGTLDATRCISDLTQRTDAIPAALRPLVGDWVWGCDLCAEVCPPAKRAAPLAEPAFAPADERANPDLTALLRLRSGEFKRRYRRTAMGWRGPAVLRRNAAVALGNGLDRASVPVLARALADDPHPLVRGHAAWALGRIGSPAAFAALRGRSDRESDRDVLAEIDAALRAETFGNARALESGT